MDTLYADWEKVLLFELMRDSFIVGQLCLEGGVVMAVDAGVRERGAGGGVISNIYINIDIHACTYTHVYVYIYVCI